MRRGWSVLISGVRFQKTRFYHTSRVVMLLQSPIDHPFQLMIVLYWTFFSLVSCLWSYIFYAPGSNDRGILFWSCPSVCPFVCLSVVNFNLRYNFWTARDRDFIFGMHTPLMKPFQMTARSMTLWPWLWPWS